MQPNLAVQTDNDGRFEMPFVSQLLSGYLAWCVDDSGGPFGGTFPEKNKGCFALVFAFWARYFFSQISEIYFLLE